MPILRSCYQAGDAIGRPGYCLQFEYNLEAINAIKRIPVIDREWRPSTKEWWVAGIRDNELTRIFSNFEAFTKYQASIF
ncbi:hypothetical protein B1772_04645 [Dehalococcoides mccartyi]|jgi:hypothetical protein|nr:hypothetical protein B1777_05235 [Dehalococcoides mccartyi]AQU07532.1 hypothetical protein B1778_05040 [Dehalococcoides mccartyi]AQX74778.1 hypothetical protein B1776_04335 [Dehalococcoides mccartyi]AQY73355.1 hypothetical protein B1772_04645 [Dehalococcoides mccartyi]